MALDHWSRCKWYSSTLISLWLTACSLVWPENLGCAKFSISWLTDTKYHRDWHSQELIWYTSWKCWKYLFHQPWKLAFTEETTEKCCFMINTASSLKPMQLFCLFNSCPNLRANTNFSFMPSTLLKVSLGSLGVGCSTSCFPVGMALYNF